MFYTWYLSKIGGGLIYFSTMMIAVQMGVCWSKKFYPEGGLLEQEILAIWGFVGARDLARRGFVGARDFCQMFFLFTTFHNSTDLASLEVFIKLAVRVQQEGVVDNLMLSTVEHVSTMRTNSLFYFCLWI